MTDEEGKVSVRVLSQTPVDFEISTSVFLEENEKFRLHFAVSDYAAQVMDDSYGQGSNDFDFCDHD